MKKSKTVQILGLLLYIIGAFGKEVTRTLQLAIADCNPTIFTIVTLSIIYICVNSIYIWVNSKN